MTRSAKVAAIAEWHANRLAEEGRRGDELADLPGEVGEALAKHEAVIERGLTTFIEVGNALMAIREQRLYRASHTTFEEYCRGRWGFSRQRAQQLIAAADAVSTVVDIGLRVPTTERQARELAKVPDGRRAEVWRETLERTNGEPTGVAVREAAASKISRHIVEVQESGGTIPPQQQPKPRRKPITDEATGAGWEIRKCADRINRILSDDRFERNREEIKRALLPHVVHALSVLVDAKADLEAGSAEVAR